MIKKLRLVLLLPLMLMLLACPEGVEIKGEFNSSKIKIDDDIEGVWKMQEEDGKEEEPLFVIEKKDDYWGYFKKDDQEIMMDFTLHKIAGMFFIAIKDRKEDYPFELWEIEFTGDDLFTAYAMKFPSENDAVEFQNTPGSVQDIVFENFIESKRLIRDSTEDAFVFEKKYD